MTGVHPRLLAAAAAATAAAIVAAALILPRACAAAPGKPAAPARPSPAGDYGPALFSFVKPGETTQSQAKKLAGDPYLEYDVDVIEGERDVLINAESDEDVDSRADAAGKKTRTVHVLEWRNPEDFADAARLVFVGQSLWYALLPVPPSESTPEKAESRWSTKPTLTQQKRKIGDVTYDVRIYAFPVSHTAYVLSNTPHFRNKVLW